MRKTWKILPRKPRKTLLRKAWKTVLWNLAGMEDCAVELSRHGRLCCGTWQAWKTVLWNLAGMEDCSVELGRHGRLCCGT